MMETSLLIQYIIVGLLVLSAFYAIFRVFRKNFSPKKFSKKEAAKIIVAAVIDFP